MIKKLKCFQKIIPYIRMPSRTGCCLLIVAAVFICLYHAENNADSQTVYLDTKRVVEVPLSQAAKQFNTEKQAHFAADYADQLPKTIRAYATQHHVAIVAGRVLANGHAIDVTNAIMYQNLAALRRHHD